MLTSGELWLSKRRSPEVQVRFPRAERRTKKHHRAALGAEYGRHNTSVPVKIQVEELVGRGAEFVLGVA